MNSYLLSGSQYFDVLYIDSHPVVNDWTRKEDARTELLQCNQTD